MQLAVTVTGTAVATHWQRLAVTFNLPVKLSLTSSRPGVPVRLPVPVATGSDSEPQWQVQPEAATGSASLSVCHGG